MTSNPKLTKHSIRENTAFPVTANRNYKDTVFRMLFSDTGNLLSLYNAINGTRYSDTDEMEIVTLDNAIYVGMKNDLAFILDMNLYLFEHQSTKNPNMPLRDLFYIAKEYQKYVEDHELSIYASTAVEIPAPRFIIFYNGTEAAADRRELRLSDLYQRPEEDPALELRVLELNVNYGHNTELLEACQTLKEYAQFVDKVRKYQENEEIHAAVARAVEECIKEGILEKFLRKNRAEVMAMCIFEYDKEEEERRMRKAYRKAYREEGREIGRNEERANTERERARAEKAEREVERLKRLLEAR